MDDQVLAGRYRLLSVLGRGGMGAVWRARDEQLGRDVAVKELRLPEHLDADQRRTLIARLDREARAAAGLKHPGIVTVHDRVTGDDGRPWIVMELVDGRSLDDALKTDGPLPPLQAAQIGLQVLAALRAAHEAGITHRDVKPANVLLEGERVVLTDFGIAAVDGDATLTGSGTLLGTPAYMSPEQVRGMAATPASDLWSLGATLYAAVEGRPPFNGASTGALFIAIATEDPPPAVRAGPLAAPITALLQRDPNQRPSPDRLHTRLTQITQPHAAPTVPETTPARPGPRHQRRPRRKRPLLLGIAAAAVVALIATIAVTAFNQRSNAKDDDRDQAAMRVYQSLSTPPGSKQSVGKPAGGKLEILYSLCVTIRDCAVTREAERTRNWLISQKGVKDVLQTGSTQACATPQGCFFKVDPAQPLTGARILRTGYQLTLKIYVQTPTN